MRSNVHRERCSNVVIVKLLEVANFSISPAGRQSASRNQATIASTVPSTKLGRRSSHFLSLMLLLLPPLPTALTLPPLLLLLYNWSLYNCEIETLYFCGTAAVKRLKKCDKILTDLYPGASYGTYRRGDQHSKSIKLFHRHWRRKRRLFWFQN